MTKKTKNQTVKGAVAAVVAVVALSAIYLQLRQPPLKMVVKSSYYLDLQTGDLFTSGNDQLPPFAAPSGGDAVAAQVFSCGQCTDHERFVGFVIKYDDATRDRLAQMTFAERSTLTPEEVNHIDQGRLVATAEADQWVPFASPAGQDILRSPPLRCGGPEAPLTACEPPQ